MAPQKRAFEIYTQVLVSGEPMFLCLYSGVNEIIANKFPDWGKFEENLRNDV